jgi:hypothetical protein
MRVEPVRVPGQDPGRNQPGSASLRVADRAGSESGTAPATRPTAGLAPGPGGPSGRLVRGDSDEAAELADLVAVEEVGRHQARQDVMISTIEANASWLDKAVVHGVDTAEARAPQAFPRKMGFVGGAP